MGFQTKPTLDLGLLWSYSPLESEPIESSQKKIISKATWLTIFLCFCEWNLSSIAICELYINHFKIQSPIWVDKPNSWEAWNNKWPRLPTQQDLLSLLVDNSLDPFATN